MRKSHAGAKGSWCVDVVANDWMWVVVGLLQLGTFLGLLAWLQTLKKKARHGNESAATKLLFPAHVNFLLVITISQVLESIIELVPLVLDSNRSPANPRNSALAIVFGMAWGLYHFAGEGMALLLLQRGCGRNAFKKAIISALLWGFFVGVCTSYNFMHPDTNASTGVRVGWTGMVFLFYVVLWLLPQSVLFRRPSFLYYARFWAVTNLLYTIAAAMFYADREVSACMFIGVEVVLFAFAKTFVAYKSLLLDAKWWRGIKTRRSSKISPLPEFDPKTAMSLAEKLDCTLQSHRLLLNFAFLEVNFADPIGAGASCRVYRGKWKCSPCAVKMLYSHEITSQAVTKYLSESLLLDRVAHHNVIKLYGICVLPPHLFLVLELCSLGSLYSLLYESGRELSWLQRLELAFDAACGIAALHSEGIAHKDIKSLNFLVHEDTTDAGAPKYVVKIADLDTSSNAELHEGELVGTLNWIAPECFSQLPYDAKKADIFSLGMVFSEILTQTPPFDRLTAKKIQQKLLAHDLPTLEPTEPFELVEEFVLLVRDMWKAEPAQRPDAEDVVLRLDALRIRVSVVQNSLLLENTNL